LVASDGKAGSIFEIKLFYVLIENTKA